MQKLEDDRIAAEEAKEAEAARLKQEEAKKKALERKERKANWKVE